MPAVNRPDDPSSADLGRVYVCLPCTFRWLVPTFEPGYAPGVGRFAPPVQGCPECKSPHLVSWPARHVDIWGTHAPEVCANCTHSKRAHDRNGVCHVGSFSFEPTGVLTDLLAHFKAGAGPGVCPCTRFAQ